MLKQQIDEQERGQAQVRAQEARRKAGIVGDWIVGGGSSLNPGGEMRSEKTPWLSPEQALMIADQEILTLQSGIDQVGNSTRPPDLSWIIRASHLYINWTSGGA